MACVCDRTPYDPEIDWFTAANSRVVDLVVMESVGCEAFATWILEEVQRWLMRSENAVRVRVVQVDVSEHGANRATVIA